VTFDTFEKYLKLKQDKVQPKKIQYFGTQERFKKVKKGDPNNFPGPGAHQMIAEWRGKTAPGKKADGKEPHWMNKVTTGTQSTRSIYY